MLNLNFCIPFNFSYLFGGKGCTYFPRYRLQVHAVVTIYRYIDVCTLTSLKYLLSVAIEEFF